MFSEYIKFNVYGNSNTFLFIKPLGKGIHAWEVVSPTSLNSRYVKVNEIKNGEEFLKSVGLWERFEKEYTNPKKDENNVNTETIDIRTSEIPEVKKEEKMVAIKIDESVDKKTVTKINETLQGEMVKRRGRPKGSKNKPKEV